MKNYLVLLLVLINTYTIFSQPISVIAGIDKDNNITIKWFSNHQFNIEGVNIYKREVGTNDWIKLNQTPIKRAEDVSQTSRDTTLLFYSALTYNKPSNPDDEGTWRIAVITNGILDPKFAEFYGMQFIDKNIVSGKTYEYKVVRITKGTEGEFSISNQVKVEPYSKPAAPSGFTEKAGEKDLKFLWSHDRKKFFAYNIYRSDSKQRTKVKINKYPIVVFEFRDEAGNLSKAEQYFIDTSLAIGKTYYYELTGIDYLGRESLPTEELAASTKDMTPPAEAFDIKISVKSDSVLLSWKIVKEDDLKEINIYRSKEFEGEYKKINKSPLRINQESFLDVLDRYEPVYYYKIETVDLSGNTTETFPKGVIVIDNKPPAQPSDLEAIGEVGRVVLKWKNNSESDLLGYFVWRSFTGKENDFLLLNPEPTSTNTYIDSLNKEINNLIIYRIKAVDTNYNESQYSKIVNVRMVDVTSPDKPILLNVSSEDLKVKLKWLKNNEPGLAGYDVFFSTDENPNSFLKFNTKLINTNFYEAEVKKAGNYSFYIVAIDSAGNISENSDTLFSSVIYKEPLNKNIKVSGFYDLNKNANIIKWNKIEQAAGFIVYRREKNDELSFPVSNFIFNEIFEDREVEKDKYYYFVRIFDKDDNSFDSEEIFPQ